jgi:hypothetical protein
MDKVKIYIHIPILKPLQTIFGLDVAGLIVEVSSQNAPIIIKLIN